MSKWNVEWNDFRSSCWEDDCNERCVNAKPSVMIGETIKEIHIDQEDDNILIETASGRCFRIYHQQDCCECVVIDSVPEGLTARLVGKVVEGASIDEVMSEETDSFQHRTVSEVRLVCDGQTEIVRWIGESNGYYSESVDFEELVKKGKA